MVEVTVLKSKYGDDIRKRQLHHQNDVSYNDLVLKIQNLYGINPNSSIHLKYRDEEGDFVTILDDDDVFLALHGQQLLFVVVTTGDAKRVESPVVETICKSEPAATIDPSRHEQVEANGFVSHTQENGVQQPHQNFHSHENDSINGSLHADRLENVPIDDKPEQKVYQPAQTPAQFEPQQLIQPQQPQQFQPSPQLQQQHAPVMQQQQAYGYNQPPAPVQTAYPPHSTPLPNPSQGGYPGYYAPPPTQTSVPSSVAPTPTGYPQHQQVPPPASVAPPAAFPPSGIAPPPTGLPQNAQPGQHPYNPFARGPAQPGAFSRPGFGNY